MAANIAKKNAMSYIQFDDIKNKCKLKGIFVCCRVISNSCRIFWKGL